MAVEQVEPNPASRPGTDDAVTHAYDAEAGEAAHPITRRSYLVRADMPWSGPATRERCLNHAERAGVGSITGPFDQGTARESAIKRGSQLA